MQTITEKKKPTLKLYGIPTWCHHHCGKMQLQHADTSTCRIAGSATHLEIGDPRLLNGGKRVWRVSWEIRWGGEEKVNGQVFFSDARLRAAFGLSDESGMGGERLLEEYGGDTAAQGYFIRYQNFLNIPGPGTGHDGDPNLSIELTDGVKNAIVALLQTKTQSVAAN